MHLPYRPPGRPASAWNLAAGIVWVLAVIGMLIHRLPLHSRTTLEIYRLAGERWMHGEYLYPDWRGFVYSPLAAAAFSPMAWLPARVSLVLWLLLNTAVFLGGFAALLRTTQVWRQGGRFHGIAFMLVTPLALGNLDVLQANPLLIGLLMLAIGCVRAERWAWAALCIGLATYLKIYPLAIGLLLVLVAPSRFSLALVLALIALGLAPFLFQHWEYVGRQYKEWVITRMADHRTEYTLKNAPLDLWLLLVRIGGLPISPGAYRVLQVLSGGGAALFAFVGRRKGWSQERLLSGIFCLGSIWMTLVGPATESYTYILLAPAVVFALVEAFLQPRAVWMRGVVSTAFALLLFSVFRNSFMPHVKGLWTMAVPPVAALVFLGYCILWLLDGRAWRVDRSEETAGPE